jgi:predicted ABC-type sugar transport system permease subunit
VIGLFLLGMYVGGALYALASSAYVLTHGTEVLNEDLQRSWAENEHLRNRVIQQVLISAMLWPIAVCYMATGRTPPW